MSIAPVIILVGTQLPENLGAAARVMANFGIKDLRLVAPLTSVDDPKAIAMAAGADTVLQGASVFSSIAAASADLTHLWATTAQPRFMVKPCCTPSEFVQNVFTPHDRFGFVFGPERTGLTNEDIVLCAGVITIPTVSSFSSLNLAQAVAIIIHSLCAQKPSQGALHESSPAASIENLSFFLKNLEEKLDKLNFWRVPHKKKVMWQNLRNIFTRANLTEQEVRTLYGVLETLSSQSNSSDLQAPSNTVQVS